MWRVERNQFFVLKSRVQVRTNDSLDHHPGNDGKEKQVDSGTRLELKLVPEGGRENTVI